MTPKQEALLRHSWALLHEQPGTASALFYARLFAIHPNARPLFRNKDMHLQGILFMQMLALFIRSLDGDEAGFAEAIKACGQRHVGYGVTHSDYEPVGRALLWALEETLGPEFDKDLRDAWEEAYRTLAATMQQASSSVL